MNKPIVVIPTYNNPLSIKKVILDVLDHDYELIVVDDGSKEPVKELLSNEILQKVTIVTHKRNQGKGSALISGATKAKELGFENFVSMDGDGQHLANQVEKLVNSNNENNQIVLGCRNFEIDNIPAKSKIGRSFHNFCIKMNTGFNIQDSLTGFRLYPVSILDLGLKQNGFSFEVEVLVKHYRKHKKIAQTIIECYYPTPEERVSHFDNYRDTLRFIKLHLQLLLFP